MKKIFIMVMLVLLALTPTLALADEFGARFWGKAPTGLEGSKASEKEQNIAHDDDLAGELQKIAPAAGDAVESQDAVSQESLGQKE